VVLNRVKLGQAPVSLHRMRWTQRGLWILLVLAVLGGGLGLWLTLDARFYVYDAEIVGNRRLSHQEIFEASGLWGLHILWARSATIESRILEALPSLESVTASCTLPSACTISIVERRPRVLWDSRSGASGGLWWIDEEGAIFAGTASVPVQDDGAGASGQEGAAGRWVVTGPLPREDGHAQDHLDEQVRVALAELWESGRDLSTAFRYSPEQGLSFVDEHGWRIIVGRGPGMARRLQVLDLLVAHLESSGVTPRFVDVRFADAPYYVPAAE
jgi:hypothetical protein